MRPWPMARILGMLIAGIIAILAQGGASSFAAYAEESGVDVLTRGPVHEAFAEPSDYNPSGGIGAPRQSPADIEEMPPEDKPEGDNVLWISGYWNWDADRSDFIWISGIWRDPPPDRSWVPGYWTAAAEGWMWTPGFWAAADSDEIEYLPKPPESLEVGPSSPPPASNRLWASGCWLWVDARYVWRPGYWVTASADWVWTPAHYAWTPTRLRLHRWLLGPDARTTRRAVCAGLFQPHCLLATALCPFADNCHPGQSSDICSFRFPPFSPLLLWRLLWRRILSQGIPPVV